MPILGVGPLRLRNVVSRVVPIPFRADDHTPVAGLLGFDFFAEIIVHVDAERGVVEALHPAAFHAPTDFAALPLGLDDKQPAVRIRIGPVAARVILDTGANRSVLGSTFAERLDFTGERAARGSGRFRGVGGSGSAETIRLKDLDFGGFTNADPLVDISAADFGFEDIDGLIGTDLMRDYDLYFDYRANTVYARHNSHPATSP